MSDIGEDDWGAHWWTSEPTALERLVSSAEQVVEGVLQVMHPRAKIASDGALNEAQAWHILVVDDDSDQRELYENALRTFGGFQVVTACDGKDALKKALEQVPDAIVTDYAMPVMDGAELAARLALEESTRRIPVVIVSAFAGEIPRKVRLSCAAFLAKPCGLKELSRIVALAITAGREQTV